MNTEEIKANLERDDEFLVGVLLALYARQTADEQVVKSTNWQNSVGFNAADAGFLSSISEFYSSRGYLTPNQITYARRMLIKYAGQLNGQEVRRMPLRPPGAPAPKKTESPAKVEMIDDQTIGITFPYDPDLVTQIKGLYGRKWDGEKKRWTVPYSLQTATTLQRMMLPLGPVIRQKMEPTQETVAPLKYDLKKALYPFQVDGLSFLEKRRGKGIIADEMGLGKTVQALAYLAAHPEARPAIVVCPASVKINWAREAEAWLRSPNVQILSGEKPSRPTGKILIINYDVLAAWLPTLNALKPAVVILDECHYIKNRAAKRTAATRKLGIGRKVICLSGTPIVNRPVEFFNALSLVDPELFPSFWQYAQRYCGAVHNGFGWDFTGATHTEELHQLLTSTVMIRRLKKDVLKDLPPKTRAVIPLQLKNESEYRRIEADFLGWLADQDPEAALSASRAETLVKIEALKQATLEGKLDDSIEWIRDFLDTGEKLVVFTTHTRTIEALMHAFTGQAVRVDGSVSMVDRQVAVDAFQSDSKIRLFVGNIRAAGVGLTLTAASNTCFLELGWTPGEHDQAEDRVHRIGQFAESVCAYYLIAQDTVEEKIIQILDKKRVVLEGVLDGRPEEEVSVLAALLDTYRQETKVG